MEIGFPTIIQNKIVTRKDWGAINPKQKYRAQVPVCIVIHHSSAPSAKMFKGQPHIRSIQAYHMATRGWIDIGYHALISPDGNQIYLGRPWDVRGGHCGDESGLIKDPKFGNNGSIGICLIGDYDTEDPTPNGLTCLTDLVREIRDYFRIPEDKVFGHFEVWRPPPKTCPGSRLVQALGWDDRWKKAFGR